MRRLSPLFGSLLGFFVAYSVSAIAVFASATVLAPFWIVFAIGGDGLAIGFVVAVGLFLHILVLCIVGSKSEPASEFQFWPFLLGYLVHFIVGPTFTSYSVDILRHFSRDQPKSVILAPEISPISELSFYIPHKRIASEKEIVLPSITEECSSECKRILATTSVDTLTQHYRQTEEVLPENLKSRSFKFTLKALDECQEQERGYVNQVGYICIQSEQIAYMEPQGAYVEVMEHRSTNIFVTTSAAALHLKHAEQGEVSEVATFQGGRHQSTRFFTVLRFPFYVAVEDTWNNLSFLTYGDVKASNRKVVSPMVTLREFLIHAGADSSDKARPAEN